MHTVVAVEEQDFSEELLVCSEICLEICWATLRPQQIPQEEDVEMFCE